MKHKRNKGQLKIFSTNINNLNSVPKRRIIFKQLEKLRAEIICLQETHIKWVDLKMLEQKNPRNNVCGSRRV